MSEFNPLQAIMDAHGEDMAKERSRSQMTLGEAIQILSEMPQDAKVADLEPLGSYRGYYRDLAFGSRGRRTLDPRGLYAEWDRATFKSIPNTSAPDEAVIPSPEEYQTIADVLADCQSALGACFEGYKGGDFWMTAQTPLWVSGYGMASGEKLMALSVEDGILTLETEQEEW